MKRILLWRFGHIQRAYMDAVKRGDAAAAQKMVDEAAKDGRKQPIGKRSVSTVNNRNIKRKPPGQQNPGGFVMAERVGFEPTVGCPITSFQDWLLKPLGQLSGYRKTAMRRSFCGGVRGI